MKNGKLTVGQIGCGAFAEGADLPNFRDNPDVHLKWCCDIDIERARAMAKKFDVLNATADFMEIVNDPEVDMIKIATSHEAHLPIIEAAAARGKHIFCEKPMAMEEPEALKIVRAVRRNGVKLCVGMNRRMSPSLIALKKAWQEHCKSPKHQPWRFVEVERDLFPEEKQTQFICRIQDQTSSYRLVHLDPLRGGGQIIGESVHWLDLGCWLFDTQDPVEILAWGSQRFSHGINVKFSGGDTLTIVFNASGTFDYPKEMYEITSYSAIFRNEFFVENTYYGVPGKEREIFSLQRDSFPEIGEEGGFSGYMKKYQASVEERGKAGKKARGGVGVDKGHVNMSRTFVKAILEDKPSPCDEMAGFYSVYLANLAMKSIELRQALPVAPDLLYPCIV